MARGLGAWLCACMLLWACGRGGPVAGRRAEPPTPSRSLPMFDAAAAADALAQVRAPGPVAVRDFRPEGPGAGAGIRLRLDRAVVDPSAPPTGVALVLERIDGDGRVHLVAGTSRWARPDILEFVPDGDLPAATAFVVRLEGRIEEPGGTAVEAVSWRFETPRPDLAMEVEEAVADDQPLFLIPTLTLEPATLAAHLRVLATDDAVERAVAVEVRTASAGEREDHGLPETALAVAPRSRWPAGKTLALVVDERLTSPAGPLPIAASWRATAQVRPAFTIGAAPCGSVRNRCPIGAVAIPTSTMVDEASIGQVRVRPALADLAITSLPGDEDDGSPPSVIVDGTWQPGRRYEITFGRKLTDEYGRRLGRTRKRAVAVGDTEADDLAGAAELSLSGFTGVFASPAEARVGVLTDHVTEVLVRVVAVRAVDAVDLVLEKDLDDVSWPDGTRDTTTRHTIAPGARHLILDLAQHGGLGDVLVVEATATALTAHASPPDESTVRGMFRISGLGVVAHRGPKDAFVRVTAVDTGEPVPDAEVQLVTASERGRRHTTDRHGIAYMEGARDERRPPMVLVQHGDDAITVPLQVHPRRTARDARHGRMTTAGRLAVRPGRYADPEPPPPGLRRGELPLLAVYTGRAVYHPGDTIHVAGWGAISTPLATTATRRIAPRTPVAVELRRGTDVIMQRTVRIDGHGRFSTSLRTPQAAAHDRYRVVVSVLGGEATQDVVVAEPRIPTFELRVTTSADEVIRGEAVEVVATAKYLSGEAASLSGARANIQCRASTPWRMDRLPTGFTVDSDLHLDTDAVELDGAIEGPAASFAFATAGLDTRRPWSCAIAVSAADQGLQEVGSDVQVFVHPAPIYLAMAQAETRAGRRHTVEIIAVDRTGRRVALAGVHGEIWRQADAGDVRVARCRADLAATGAPSRCVTGRLGVGRYRVRATATVDGTPIVLQQRFEVFEPRPEIAASPSAAWVEVAAPAPPRPVPFAIELPEKVQANERVTVTITGPWPTATGVLAVEQIGLREVIPFVMVDGRARLGVIAAPDLGPTLELVARVARPGIDGKPPQELTTEAWAEIEQDRGLTVEITAPEQVRIGETASVQVEVTDAQGRPVDARLALWVVDEGLHQLREARPPSLGSIFDLDRRGERSVTRSYDALLEPFVGWRSRHSHRAPQIRQAQATVMGGGPPDRPRQRFDGAPLFIGNLGTGVDGTVSIPLPLPDDLTRFRITAIASSSVPGNPEAGPARFGSAVASIATSSPLNVRAAMPRVLRPGDRATVAALVTMPRDGALEVALELPDAGVRAVGATRRTVRGRAGTTVRAAFVVDAQTPGTPRVRLRARVPAVGRALARSGAVDQKLRIEAERTASDAVAIYGSLDDDETWALPIRLPAGALPSTGSIDVSTSNSTIGELTDAAEYLEQYPYGCVEQSSSRLVPLVAWAGLAGRSADAAAAAATAPDLVAHILSMQRADGMFAYWPGSQRVHGYASAYALWLLQLADSRGIEVPATALARARAAMAKLVRGPASSTEADDRLAQVFVLDALALAGEATAGDFDGVYEVRGTLPTVGRLMLTKALHRTAPDDPRLPALVRGLSALLEERAGVAHVVVPSDVGRATWDSPTRDDAIALITLLQVSPDDARIDKLARGLSTLRVRGRWRTTQENAFALLALAEYAQRREPTTPDHRVRAWVGRHPVLDAQVTAFDAQARRGEIGLDALRESAGAPDTTQVVLRREGRGRVHWRVGVRWTEADPQPRAQGITVRSRILDERGAVVTQLVAGRRYRVEVAVAADMPQRFIAVELPLPAGVDAVERHLGHGIAARAASTIESSALSHLELRPDRALLFFDALEPGTTVQQVAVLATAKGSYAVPGATAEAMYEPELRARGAATRIEIVEGATPP